MPKPGSESVLGFAFSPHAGRLPWVALVLKDHPEWAANKLNGVGGAVEPPEEPRAAMAREFAEETGVETREEDWRLVAVLGRAAGHTMYVYAAHLSAAVSLDDEGPEPCDWYASDLLPKEVLPNLRWLVPLCLDDRLADVVHVPYRGRSSDPPQERADG